MRMAHKHFLRCKDSTLALHTKRKVEKKGWQPTTDVDHPPQECGSYDVMDDQPNK